MNSHTRIGFGLALCAAIALMLNASKAQTTAPFPPSKLGWAVEKSRVKIASEGDATFKKEAIDVNGGALEVGDEIKYVLTYSAAALASSSTTIVDTLSPNQSYLSGTLEAEGWSWTPTTPYSVNNTTTYTSDGSGLSVTVNVPETVTVAGVNNTSYGDGTIPIPIGPRVYGIFHHRNYQVSGGTQAGARIMCWDLYTLQPCDPTWSTPKLLDSGPGPGERTTHQIAHHGVIGKRIYYASASYDSATSTTTFGIGCWDTYPLDTPCAFIPLPATASGKIEGYSLIATTNLRRHTAGVIGIPNFNNPNSGRVYMQAGNAVSGNDAVYCILVPASVYTPCPGWNTPSLGATNNTGVPNATPDLRDMILEESTSPSRLYVGVGDASSGTNLACIDLATGQFCSGWPNTPVNVASFPLYSLSPVLSTAGNTTVGVCVHRWSGAKQCFDALNGLQLTANTANVPNKNVLIAFHIPGTRQVLYPNYKDGAVQCRDFSSGIACPNFTPGWNFTSPAGGFSVYDTQDYGYAVDPAHSDQCLLGLGNTGKLWRFTRNGSMQDPASGANLCEFPLTYTLDINDYFCDKKPTSATWQTVEILNRPSQLIGGVIELFSANSTTPAATINVVQGVNSYNINVPAAGANNPLTVKFTPTFQTGYVPDPNKYYKLKLTFSADTNPQICYRATAKCGPVFNKATLTLPGVHPMTAQTDLGEATGEGCKEDSTLKICKVAGEGVAVGTLFTFTVNGITFTVPAGPPPGGYCVVAGTYASGAQVPIDETGPPGYSVSNIQVVPSSSIVTPPGIDLSQGTVTVAMGSGVTEVTYTDQAGGYLEICKAVVGHVPPGNYKFDVPGYGTVDVPAGACSPAIPVNSGQLTITELTRPPNTAIVAGGCYTLPSIRQLGCIPVLWQSIVNIVPGDISTMTIATITNGPKHHWPPSGHGE